MPALLINFLNKRKSLLPRSRLIWPSHIGSLLQKKKYGKYTNPKKCSQFSNIPKSVTNKCI